MPLFVCIYRYWPLLSTTSSGEPRAPPAAHTDQVVNVDDVQEVDYRSGDCWGGFDKPLTAFMRAKGGSLGVNLSRLPPGRTMCPFHFHEREDEVFFVLSGRGCCAMGRSCASRVLACVSYPAGTKVAHQIANPFAEDLTRLAIGPHDAHDVAVYPDSGKVLVRSLGEGGFFQKSPYLDGEPQPPKIFELARRTR